MRGTWLGLRWLAIVLLGLAGCHSTGPKYTPPKHPEDYTLPPDDNRFSDPHAAYPREAMNKGKIKKDATPNDLPSMRSPSRMGGGMGGPF
jgi:hypothetical protein